MSEAEKRLAALGITLPEAAAPVADYRPYALAGGLLFVSGQIPLRNGALAFAGQLGRDCSLEEAQEAARICAINCIAQARAALDGDLERVRQVVKLTGFVNATADFTDHPKVVDAASAVMAAAFGEAGRHARAAVGCSSLPLGAPVEVEAVFLVGQQPGESDHGGI